LVVIVLNIIICPHEQLTLTKKVEKKEKIKEKEREKLWKARKASF